MDSLYVVLKSLRENNWLNTEFLSLVIALLAVIFGPLIAHYTAKKTMRAQIRSIKEQIDAQTEIAKQNINASVLSNNRQDWINRLRDNISEFLSLGLIASEETVKGIDLTNIYERILTIRFKIDLFINPKEDDHNKLSNLLDEYMNQYVFKKKYKEENEPRGLATQIVKISQSILKREWERVKTLK